MLTTSIARVFVVVIALGIFMEPLAFVFVDITKGVVGSCWFGPRRGEATISHNQKNDDIAAGGGAKHFHLAPKSSDITERDRQPCQPCQPVEPKAHRVPMMSDAKWQGY